MTQQDAEIEGFGVWLMKVWYLIGAILLVVFLAWGYFSGHCVLCQKVKNAITAPITAGPA